MLWLGRFASSSPALNTAFCAESVIHTRETQHNPRKEWQSERDGLQGVFSCQYTAVGKKNNAADRPRPADHRLQGVMPRVPSFCRAGGIPCIHC